MVIPSIRFYDIMVGAVAVHLVGTALAFILLCVYDFVPKENRKFAAPSFAGIIKTLLSYMIISFMLSWMVVIDYIACIYRSIFNK